MLDLSEKAALDFENSNASMPPQMDPYLQTEYLHMVAHTTITRLREAMHGLRTLNMSPTCSSYHSGTGCVSLVFSRYS